MSEDGDEIKIDDSNLKVHQLVDRRGQKSAKGKGLSNLFPLTVQASMTPLEKDPWKDMPMITLKHRWMKSRNLVAGVTVVSFNHEGIAKVQDRGNARLDVDSLVQHAGGLIEILDEDAASQPLPEPAKVLTPPAPAKPQQAAPEPAEEAPEPETAEDEDEGEESLEEGGDPSLQPKRKAPPKRKK